MARFSVSDLVARLRMTLDERSVKESEQRMQRALEKGSDTSKLKKNLDAAGRALDVLTGKASEVSLLMGKALGISPTQRGTTDIQKINRSITDTARTQKAAHDARMRQVAQESAAVRNLSQEQLRQQQSELKDKLRFAQRRREQMPPESYQQARARGIEYAEAVSFSQRGYSKVDATAVRGELNRRLYDRRPASVPIPFNQALQQADNSRVVKSGRSLSTRQAASEQELDALQEQAKAAHVANIMRETKQRLQSKYANERIVAAALRRGDTGSAYAGMNHGDAEYAAFDKTEPAPTGKSTPVDLGFMTNTGRFVGRRRAELIRRIAKQRKEITNQVDMVEDQLFAELMPDIQENFAQPRKVQERGRSKFSQWADKLKSFVKNDEGSFDLSRTAQLKRSLQAKWENGRHKYETDDGRLSGIGDADRRRVNGIPVYEGNDVMLGKPGIYSMYRGAAHSRAKHPRDADIKATYATTERWYADSYAEQNEPPGKTFRVDALVKKPLSLDKGNDVLTLARAMAEGEQFKNNKQREHAIRRIAKRFAAYGTIPQESDLSDGAYNYLRKRGYDAIVARNDDADPRGGLNAREFPRYDGTGRTMLHLNPDNVRMGDADGEPGQLFAKQSRSIKGAIKDFFKSTEGSIDFSDAGALKTHFRGIKDRIRKQWLGGGIFGASVKRPEDGKVFGGTGMHVDAWDAAYGEDADPNMLDARDFAAGFVTRDRRHVGRKRGQMIRKLSGQRLINPATDMLWSEDLPSTNYGDRAVQIRTDPAHYPLDKLARTEKRLSENRPNPNARSYDWPQSARVNPMMQFLEDFKKSDAGGLDVGRVKQLAGRAMGGLKNFIRDESGSLDTDRAKELLSVKYTKLSEVEQGKLMGRMQYTASMIENKGYNEKSAEAQFAAKLRERIDILAKKLKTQVEAPVRAAEEAVKESKAGTRVDAKPATLEEAARVVEAEEKTRVVVPPTPPAAPPPPPREPPKTAHAGGEEEPEHDKMNPDTYPDVVAARKKRDIAREEYDRKQEAFKAAFGSAKIAKEEADNYKIIAENAKTIADNKKLALKNDPDNAGLKKQVEGSEQLARVSAQLHKEKQQDSRAAMSGAKHAADENTRAAEAFKRAQLGSNIAYDKAKEKVRALGGEIKKTGDESEKASVKAGDAAKKIGKSAEDGAKGSVKAGKAARKATKETSDGAEEAAAKTKIAYGGLWGFIKGGFDVLGRYLVVWFGVRAMFNWVTDSIRLFAQFDAKMKQSMSIMGDVGDEMQKALGDKAREIAKNLNIDFDIAAESIYYLASAGYKANEILANMPIVATFAKAGMMDVAKATELLSRAQNALGYRTGIVQVDMLEMKRVSDVLVKAETESIGTIEEFTEALTNKSAAALRVMNKDVEEGVAALAALHDQGIKGSVAGERLAIFLREVGRSSQKAPKMWEDVYGIHVFDKASGKMRNIADIVKDLTKAIGKLKPQAQFKALTDLKLNYRSIDTIRLFFGMGDKIQRYIDEFNGATGKTAEVAQKQLLSVSERWGLIGKKINDVRMQLVEELLPAFEKMFEDFGKDGQGSVIGALKSILEWIRNNKEEIVLLGDSFATAMRIAVKAVDDVIDMLDSLHQTVILVEAAVKGLGGVFAKFHSYNLRASGWLAGGMFTAYGKELLQQADAFSAYGKQMFDESAKMERYASELEDRQNARFERRKNEIAAQERVMAEMTGRRDAINAAGTRVSGVGRLQDPDIEKEKFDRTKAPRWFGGVATPEGRNLPNNADRAGVDDAPESETEEEKAKADRLQSKQEGVIEQLNALYARTTSEREDDVTNSARRIKRRILEAFNVSELRKLPVVFTTLDGQIIHVRKQVADLFTQIDKNTADMDIATGYEKQLEKIISEIDKKELIDPSDIFDVDLLKFALEQEKEGVNENSKAWEKYNELLKKTLELKDKIADKKFEQDIKGVGGLEHVFDTMTPEQMKLHRKRAEMFTDLYGHVADQMASQFEWAFDRINDGAQVMKTVFNGLGRAISSSMASAIADWAMMKAKENVVMAAEDTAYGIGMLALGQPGAGAMFLAAAKHLAVAAAWGALGGAASGGASALARGGGKSDKRSKDKGDSTKSDRQNGEITIYIDGVDPKNPRHQRLIAETQREAYERGIKINIKTGNGR